MISIRPGDPTLDRLLTRGGRGAVFVSIYVDLDPTEFGSPRARRAQVESLTDAARQRFTRSDQHRGLAHEDTLTQDVERVRRYLEAYSPQGAAALAVFCSTGAGVFEVIRLRQPLRPAMRIGRRPWLKPLVAVRPELLDCTVFAVGSRRRGCSSAPAAG